MKYKETMLGCPVRKALETIGGKWRLLILDQIGEHVKRYGYLRRQIPDITERVLIRELKELQEAGLLEKKSYGEVPPRVEYWLTPKGKEAITLIEGLRRFGQTYRQEA